MNLNRIFVGLALIATVMTSSPADAAKPKPRSQVVTVQQVGHNNQFAIVLKNGVTWVVPACKYEDSRNCWWDAGRSGNKQGRSFADLNGKVHRLAKNGKIFMN